MDQYWYEHFKEKIEKIESKHVKLDKIELDKEGDLILEIINNPIGYKFKISDKISSNPVKDAEFCFRKAEAMIKIDAVKEAISWLTESKRVDEVNGVGLLVDKNMPDDVILMNPVTFLKFREMMLK